MQHRTTVRSPGAIVLGLLCCLGTLAILFWDFVEARSLKGFSQTHLYILLALVVAYGAGHFTFAAYERTVFGRIRGTALFLLFAGATVICVGLSGARTSATLDQKVADVANAGDKRTRLQGRITHADAARKASRTVADQQQAKADKLATEAADACKKGVYCKSASDARDSAQRGADGWEKNARTDEQTYQRLLGQLDALAAPQRANAALEKLAAILSFGATSQASFLPYLFALLTEFGSIAFFSVGFGHEPAERSTKRPQAKGSRRAPNGSDAKPSEPNGDHGPNGSGPGGQVVELAKVRKSRLPRLPKRPNGSMSKVDAERFVVTQTALGREMPSQEWLRDRCGISKATANAWLNEWERKKLITRKKVGRRNVIVAGKKVAVSA